MAWTRLVSGSTAGNVSLNIDYNVTGCWRTSNTNVRVTFGIRFAMATSTYTYNSIAAFIGGTRYYAFNYNSGHTNAGTWYYANTSGSTTTWETAPFTIDIPVGITQTSASFDVGYGWDAWTPNHKGTSTIWVSFPTGATAPTGLSCSVSGTTETSCTLSGGYSSNGNATVTAEGYQYKKDGGSWTNCSSSLTGLSPSTKYYFRYYATNSQGTSYSGETNTTTFAYPYITSAPDFTIGNQLTIKFYNPLGRSCAVYIKNPLNEEVGGDTTTGTDITGYTGTDFQDFLYRGIPDAQSGRYKVRLLCGAVDRDTTVDGGIYKIKGTETPTFNDTNITNITDTLLKDTITGNGSKIIKGHNKITGSITKMTPNYSSNGNKYVVNASGTPNTQELSYDNGATKTFTIENITTNSISVTAYDTRTLYTSRTKNVDLIEYSKPKVTEFTVTRLNGLGEYINIKIDGTITYWSGWSEIKKYNSVQKVYLRYKLSSANEYEMAWKDITSLLTKNTDGTWEISGTLDDVFSVTNKYDFEVYATDLLESSSTSSSQLSTANGFLWRDLKNKRLGINKKPTCALDVNGDVNVDGVITSRNKVEVDNEVVATQVKADTLYQKDKPVLDYEMIETGVMKYKDVLLSDVGIHYPVLNDLNNIGNISTGQVIQINWYPTLSAGQKNGPSGADGLVLTFSPHPDYVYQLAYTGGNPVKVYTRSKHVNVWYGWKELLLKEELPSIPQLQGTYPLLHVPYTSTSTGQYQIGNVYSFKETLLATYPLKDGFKRTYKVMVDGTSSNNVVYIYLGGNQIAEYSVWGANSPHHSRTFVNDITNIVNSIGNGHCSLDVKNVNNSGNTWYYLNSITLLVYDTYVG